MNVAVPPHDKAADATALPVLSYTFGPFRLDVLGRRLFREDVVVPLLTNWEAAQTPN